MSKVLIDRELLERLLYSNSPARFDATEYNAARAELFAILAQPAQQGEVVEVVGYLDAHDCLWNETTHPDRMIPLMTVGQHQHILADVRHQLAKRDAEILEQCRLNGMGAERELKLIAQRDKLAVLLRKVLATHDYHTDDGEHAADEKQMNQRNIHDRKW